MNIFIIPSWYPSINIPLSGIFILEQAEAIAELCPDIRVIVSTWGHGDAEFSIRQPKIALKSIYWRLRQPCFRVEEKKGIWEIFHPVLNWSERLPFGGVSRLVKANRKNLLKSMELFGKIDVIHAHVSFPGGYIANKLSKEFHIPYVLTEHMGPFPFPNLMHKSRPRQEIYEAFDEAAYSIAVSPSLAERISSFGLTKPHILPNMVDERKFAVSRPKDGRFIFFTLCGITDQKGIDHLLKSIALWNPDPSDVEFRIGGNGPMLKEYQAMADRLGVADRVVWLGEINRHRATSLFRECHVYVMPSRHETFGIVYAEAIASGKPVIASRCGGPEFIINNDNGRLVAIDNIEELAEVMSWMKNNWRYFDQKIIRQDFEARFSRTAVVNNLRSIYQMILKV